MFKTIASLLAVGGMVGGSVFAVVVPSPLASETVALWHWRSWVIGIGLLAVLGYALQLWLQGREDKERDKRLNLMADLLQKIARGEVPKPSEIATEESVKTSDPVVLSSHEQLEKAQEAVFVDDVLTMPEDTLKIELGHDPEFRKKFEVIPKGKYAHFDDVRSHVFGKPIIAARFVRAHLMPWSPFSGMVKDLFKSTGKPDYETRADFLFRIYLVNITHNTTTIQQITAEAEIAGKWTKLPRLDDLSNYELLTFQHKDDAEGPFARDRGKVEELVGLWDKIKGNPLEYGVGFEGWVGFEVTAMSTEFDKPVNHKVRLVDALGGIHPVVTLKAAPELELYGEIRHTQKMYDRN